MGDYAKTDWVEGVTKVGPTNLNKLEEGVRVAGKRVRAAMTGALEDTGVTWFRTVGGALVAYHRTIESGASPNRTTDSEEYYESEGTGQASKNVEVVDEEGSARLYIVASPGGRKRLLAFATDALGNNRSALILDDLGASDFTLAAQAKATSVMAYRNAAGSVVAGQAVIFDAEEISGDPSGFYDTATGKFQPTVAGRWQLTTQIASLGAMAALDRYVNPIFSKNGLANSTKAGPIVYERGVGVYAGFTAMLDLNGSTDYVQVRADHTQGAALNLQTGAAFTYFQARLVGV